VSVVGCTYLGDARYVEVTVSNGRVRLDGPNASWVFSLQQTRELMLACCDAQVIGYPERD
jgi:hypothetical protein